MRTLIFLLLTSFCFSDVKSNQGQIKFNSGSELTLNESGLGINVSPSEKLHVTGKTTITDSITIGNSDRKSSFNLDGTIGYSIQSIEQDTELEENTYILVDSSSDNIRLTLPYAGNVTGRQYLIKKTSTQNSVWVTAAGNLIDDTNPVEIPNNNALGSLKLMSDGEQWYVLSQKNTSSTIASDNLIAWWKLDETSGVSVSDSSDLSNTGTMQNSMTFSSNGINAVIGRGLVFNGVNDFIDIGDPADGSFDFTENESFSICTWVKMGTDTSTDRIITKRSGLSGFELVSRNNKTSLFLGDGSQFFHVDIGATDITDEEWHFIVINVDRENDIATAYVNGNFDGSRDFSANNIDSLANNASLTISNASSYNGQLDDPRIYNRLLTTDEIAALYSQE